MEAEPTATNDKLFNNHQRIPILHSSMRQKFSSISQVVNVDTVSSVPKSNGNLWGFTSELRLSFIDEFFPPKYSSSFVDNAQMYRERFKKVLKAIVVHTSERFLRTKLKLISRKFENAALRNL